MRKLGGNCVLGNHDAFTRIVAAEGVPKPKGWNSGVWAGVEHAVREMDEDALRWLYFHRRPAGGRASSCGRPPASAYTRA